MNIAGKVKGYLNEFENIVLDLVDALPSSPTKGQIVWLNPDGAIYVYNGTDWVMLLSTNSPVTDAHFNTLIVDHDSILGKDTYSYDNVITLNYGESGFGVQQWGTPYIAGIEIDRGSADNVALYYKEGTGFWTLTNDGSTEETILTDISGANWFLRLDGSNLPQHDISWNNFKITNLADPSDPLDAVNKQYADSLLTGGGSLDTLYLRIDGSNSPTSNIDWSNYRIVNLANPVDNHDASTKLYVDYQIANHDIQHNDSFIRRDGTNGPLTHISWNHYRITNLSDPEDDLDAVNLQTIYSLFNQTFYIDYVSGNDNSRGDASNPLQTITEAIRRTPIGGKIELYLLSDYTFSSAEVGNSRTDGILMVNLTIRLHLNGYNFIVEPYLASNNYYNYPKFKLSNTSFSICGTSGGSEQLILRSRPDMSHSWENGATASLFSGDHPAGRNFVKFGFLDIVMESDSRYLVTSGIQSWAIITDVLFESVNISRDGGYLLHIQNSDGVATLSVSSTNLQNSGGAVVSWMDVVDGIVYDSNGIPRNLVSNIIF